MTYSELQDLCRARKKTVKSVYEAIDMTKPGFAAAFENQSLPMRKIVPLCQVLGITPNEFFGVQDAVPSGAKIHGSQIGGSSNTLNYGKGSAASVKVLVDQLAEKDKQIARLLELLDKK